MCALLMRLNKQELKKELNDIALEIIRLQGYFYYESMNIVQIYLKNRYLMIIGV